jgi:DNA-directed RNA polymerase sigma subunit (sigma70/sigma32)
LGDASSANHASNWLDLVQADTTTVWHDRLIEMQALSAQGETLAAIGERFGLSAERVRQILRDT